MGADRSSLNNSDASDSNPTRFAGGQNHPPAKRVGFESDASLLLMLLRSAPITGDWRMLDAG
jgi:hypothetical protein